MGAHENMRAEDPPRARENTRISGQGERKAAPLESLPEWGRPRRLGHNHPRQAGGAFTNLRNVSRKGDLLW